MSTQRPKNQRFFIPVFPILFILAVMLITVPVYRGEYRERNMEGVLETCGTISEIRHKPVSVAHPEQMIFILVGGEKFDASNVSSLVPGIDVTRPYTFFVKDGAVIAIGPTDRCS